MKKGILLTASILMLSLVFGCSSDDPKSVAGPGTPGSFTVGTCGGAFPIFIDGATSVPISSYALPAGLYDYIGANLDIDRTNYGVTERWQVSEQVNPNGIVSTIACTNPTVDLRSSIHGSTIGMFKMYVSPEGRHDLQLQEYFIRRDRGYDKPTWVFGSPSLTTSDFNTYVGWLGYYTDDYHFFSTGPDTYEYRSLVAYYNDGGLIHINLSVRLHFTPLGRGPQGY